MSRKKNAKTKWELLPVPDHREDYEGHREAVRLNSFGSLYFFAKHVVGYSRLSTLHEYLCKSLEAEDLALVLEVPMSHFKTRLGIALSIWWALPFDIRGEEKMENLGYGPEWIRHMKAMHHQNHRTLVTHEIYDQAVAIGRDVDFCYQHNDLFRECFREILPDRDCVWNNANKFQKRLPGDTNDSGTANYVYRGVGQALQGIHGNGTIQDDNFGREAQTSLLKGDGRVTEALFRWHDQVATRFDPDKRKKRRRLVIGNRWAHYDLNAYIRKTDKNFKFETHSAEGGCCKLHPKRKSILPSEWTWEALKEEERRLGKYDYSHFYLNQATLAEEQIFKESWLRKFTYKESNPTLPKGDLRNILLIEHSVYNGTVIEDMQPGILDVLIIVDPNHAKKNNRSKHVIWTIGMDPETSRIYLLSLWQRDATYSVLVEEMYKQYDRWTMRNSFKHTKTPNVYMGKLAKELLSFYLAERDKREKVPMDVEEFDDDPSVAAMKNRIESLEPTFKNEQIWCNPEQDSDQADFVDAFENYPAGPLDSLDVLGFLPRLVETGDSTQAAKFWQQQLANQSG